MLTGCKGKMDKQTEMYVNGSLVDNQLVTFERNEQSDKIVLLIPVVKLFEGLGYSVIWVDDHTARIERDDYGIILDIKEHTLDVDDEYVFWDRFTLMPGDTIDDFIVKEGDHELLVCVDYVESAFELLYIDIKIEVKDNRVFITSDGVEHTPYWLVGKPECQGVSREPSP